MAFFSVLKNSTHNLAHLLSVAQGDFIDVLVTFGVDALIFEQLNCFLQCAIGGLGHCGQGRVLKHGEIFGGRDRPSLPSGKEKGSADQQGKNSQFGSGPRSRKSAHHWPPVHHCMQNGTDDKKDTQPFMDKFEQAELPFAKEQEAGDR